MYIIIVKTKGCASYTLEGFESIDDAIKYLEDNELPKSAPPELIRIVKVVRVVKLLTKTEVVTENSERE